MDIVGQFCDKLQAEVNATKKENVLLRETLSQIYRVCVDSTNKDDAISKVIELVTQDTIVKGGNYEDALPI